jgi:preprotein translocase subunit YajC
MDLYKIPFLYLLQEEGGAPAGDAPPTSGPGQFLFIMVGMILIFYFLMIRPNMKEQKRRKEMLAAVKKHDRVITNGGMHGVVVSVSDADVTLKIDENVRVKFSRSAIATVLSEETPES